MVKIFELVIGHPPFDTFMPNKDDLIREWISMFGNLPEEWTEHRPLPKATGTSTLTSLSIVLRQLICCGAINVGLSFRVCDYKAMFNADSQWTSNLSKLLSATGCMKHTLTTTRNKISLKQISMLSVLSYNQRCNPALRTVHERLIYSIILGFNEIPLLNRWTGISVFPNPRILTQYIHCIAAQIEQVSVAGLEIGPRLTGNGQDRLNASSLKATGMDCVYHSGSNPLVIYRGKTVGLGILHAAESRVFQ